MILIFIFEEWTKYHAFVVFFLLLVLFGLFNMNQHLKENKPCKKLNGPISKLKRKLKNNPDYREEWKANIAMSFKDTHYQYKNRNGKIQLNTEDIHLIADEAADNFINLLCKE